MKNLFLILILLNSFVISQSLNFQVINSIGDERDDYFFYEIGGAVCTADKDIFVIDTKGRCVSKFNWEGKFIKKIGQKGQGPGDFNLPSKISFYNKEIRIYDRLNFGVLTLDQNLNVLHYIKLRRLLFFNVYPLKNDQFLGLSLFNFRAGEKHLITVFNKSEKILASFFNNEDVITKYSDMNISDLKMYSSFFNITVGISNKKELVLTTQRYVMNPASFSLYNMSGELLNQFSYKYNNNYKFINVRSMKRNRNPYINTVESIMFSENSIFVHVVPVENLYNKNKLTEVHHFLVFNKSGKFLLRKNIDKKFGEKFYQITDDNYLIGSRMEDDINKIVISKIEVKNQ